MAEPGRGAFVDWLLKPRVLLTIAAVTLVIAGLQISTTDGTEERSAPLSTYSASSGGARGIYQVAQRLGWRVSRRLTAFREPLDTTAVYAVLEPRLPPSAGETHVLLDAVRHGAGLVYVIVDRSPLSDSLRIGWSDSGYTMHPLAVYDTGGCPARDPGSPYPLWFDSKVHLYRLVPLAQWPSDTSVFVTVELRDKRRSTAPASVGIPFGAGRVAVLSDADLLRNDAIRICRWGLGVAAVRTLDWVSAGRRPSLVFDEYHLGEGQHGGMNATIWTFLTDVPAGRVVLQITIAALVLLLAVGIRAIAPTSPRRIERRSALEYVEALARAYSQAGATRTAARRLIRGLRRRHAHGTWRLASDDRFLTSVVLRHPQLAGDVQLLRAATTQRIDSAALLKVGEAVHNIDRTLLP